MRETVSNPAMQPLGELLMAPASKIVPKPGVYENVPMWEYHAWDAASNSRLSKLLRSPAHLRAYLDEPPEDREALIIGRAAHMAVLEPSDFDSKYARLIEGHGATKAVKEARAALEAKHGVGYVLKPDEYDCATSIREAIRSHAKAAKLLHGEGRVELSVVWVDRDTGLLMKARFDKHAPTFAGGAIVDLKSCRDASKDAFAKAIHDHGYARQGALYLEGAEANGIKAEHFVNVCVEKERPFAVAIYRIDEASLARGATQLKRLKASYAECLATNTWPGFSPDVEDIGLPDWSARRIDEEAA